MLLRGDLSVSSDHGFVLSSESGRVVQSMSQSTATASPLILQPRYIGGVGNVHVLGAGELKQLLG